jgi:hypothetical protein
MGRPRIKSLSYEEITAQAEKTINFLMNPAHNPLSSEAAKEQAVSHAVGALVLWEDLTENKFISSATKDKFIKLLNCEAA